MADGEESAASAGVLRTFEDAVADPWLLAGLEPAAVAAALLPAPGWREERLRRGSGVGRGWVLREYAPSGQPTGRHLRWHPGGGRKGPDPYWRVIDYNSRSEPIQ
jgi:hypothetical protein